VPILDLVGKTAIIIIIIRTLI